MSFLVNINDFVGRYRIAVSTSNSATFQKYIDQIEEQLIISDFGLDFYDEVVADASKSKFQDLLAKRYKDFLLGGVYFYYQRDGFINSSRGAVKTNAENSTNVSDAFNSGIASDRYNLGVGYYNRETLEFLNNNAVIDYTVLSTNDLGNGQYTLNLSKDLVYLYVGDDVEIKGVKYEVLAVTSNSITIEVSEDLTGQKVESKPFIKSNFEEKDVILF